MIHYVEVQSNACEEEPLRISQTPSSVTSMTEHSTTGPALRQPLQHLSSIPGRHVHISSRIAYVSFEALISKLPRVRMSGKRVYLSGVFCDCEPRPRRESDLGTRGNLVFFGTCQSRLYISTRGEQSDPAMPRKVLVIGSCDRQTGLGEWDHLQGPDAAQNHQHEREDVLLGTRT